MTSSLAIVVALFCSSLPLTALGTTCLTAQVLPEGSIKANLADGTLQTLPPTCMNPPGLTTTGLWYTYTPTENGTLTIDCSLSGLNNVSATLSYGDCDNLQCVISGSGVCSIGPEDAVAGYVYRYFVSGTTSAGEFDITTTYSVKPLVSPGLYEDMMPDFLSVVETCLPDVWETIMDATSGTTNQPAPSNPMDPNNSEQSEGMSQTALTAINQYFRSIGANICDAAAVAQMDQAMKDFTQCTNGMDMMTFIQYLPSALIGSGLQCFLGAASKHNAFSPQAYTGGPDEEVLSDACMEAMFGHNAMGDVLRTAFTTPGKMIPCFADLSQAIPGCLYAAWPMPVVGTWLKEISCLLGSMEPFLEKICEVELLTLDACLVPNSADFCATANDECFLQPKSTGDPFSFYMMFPAQILGVPIMDKCQAKAVTNATLARGLSKYNAFVEQCVVHGWDGWGGATSPATATTAAPTTAATDLDAGTTRDAGAGTNVGATSGHRSARSLVGGLGFHTWNHRHWFGGDGGL